MSEQPWSVYETRGGCRVQRWHGNAGLVAIFTGEKEAREHVRTENRASRDGAARERVAG